MDIPDEGVGGASLAELLARRLAESGQSRGSAITVAELHRVLIPYGACRDALGFATKAEYDIALLRLLEGQHVVRIQEEGLAETVARELASPEPGLAFLKNFAASPLKVLRASEGEPERETEATVAAETDAETDAEADAEADAETAAEANAETGAVGAAAEEDAAAEADAPAGPDGDDWLAGLEEEGTPGVALAEACWQCAARLPERPAVRFCPECGADQAARRCRKCGETLEPAWRFCPRCGGPVEED